ncbi:MAG: NADH-quinone oxidoreductase subunit N [Actinobacteria bacterium]|nr:NADH-quinone oxidoreductase subunit N [Actinomycetota bacterium]
MIPTPEISLLAILPELILALGAAAILLVEVQWKPATTVLGGVAGFTLAGAGAAGAVQWADAQQALGLGASGDLVAFSGMITVDGFAVFARLALLVVAGFGLAAGWRYFAGLGRRGAEALALVLLATTGFSIMVASNNLIMLFLGLEVGSIALYVLAGLTGERGRSDEAAMKYFLLGSFASAIFVYGAALLYAGTGQLEILAIRSFLGANILASPAVALIGLALVLVGLAFKVSAAPFHSWAPDVYQGAPAGVTGYMAAMAKIAGFAAIARFLLRGVPELDGSWLPLVAAISALSMVVGALLALVQDDVRRMLAYSGVAHAGFIMTGVVGGATSGVLFYVAVYSIQLVGAFAVVASVSGPANSASPLTDYRGLSGRSPAMAAAFTVLLLGMAGLPLTSGFVAKFSVFADAWAAGFGWLVLLAVVATVATFVFYLRIIVAMYMDEPSEGSLAVDAPARWVLAVTAAITVLWGIFPGMLLDMARDAFPL